MVLYCCGRRDHSGNIRLVMDAWMDTRRPRVHVRQNAPSRIKPFSLSWKNTCFGKGFCQKWEMGGESCKILYLWCMCWKYKHMYFKCCMCFKYRHNSFIENSIEAGILLCGNGASNTYTYARAGSLMWWVIYSMTNWFISLAYGLYPSSTKFWYQSRTSIGLLYTLNSVIYEILGPVT